MKDNNSNQLNKTPSVNNDYLANNKKRFTPIKDLQQTHTNQKPNQKLQHYQSVEKQIDNQQNSPKEEFDNNNTIDTAIDKNENHLSNNNIIDENEIQNKIIKALSKSLGVVEQQNYQDDIFVDTQNKKLNQKESQVKKPDYLTIKDAIENNKDKYENKHQKIQPTKQNELKQNSHPTINSTDNNYKKFNPNVKHEFEAALSKQIKLDIEHALDKQIQNNQTFESEYVSPIIIIEENKIQNDKKVVKPTLTLREKELNLINEGLKNKDNNKLLSKWIVKKNKKHRGVSDLKPLGYQKENVIQLEHVNKFVTNGYNNLHILKDINLTIKEGEFVVIYGPSGSGKTTLLSLISALDRPTTGICQLVDKNSLGLGEHSLTVFRRKNVGYIFQQYGLLNDLSVYDNIMIAATLQKDKTKRIDVDKLLKDVGMFEHKHKRASNLSGGQAQRVAICRAIVKSPKILFGDEPTGAIHVDATKQILHIFKNINKEYNTTIVLVTHNEKFLEIASRVIKVDDGKITSDYYNKNIKEIEEVEW